MKLAEFFAGNKQIDSNGKAQQKSVQNVALVNRQIHVLKPGQTLQGEVIAKNGSEVQIKIAEDLVIRARVEQNVNIDIGKNMTFEVKNNGQTLTLFPLYTNTAMDANVLKALEMAALPVTTDTVSMTEQMMQAGLSIDRNSLQQVFRESNLYPESKMADVIDLHKLSIPVNETNLTQIASYKNLTYQLEGGLQEVINTLPDSIGNLIQNGDMDGAAKLFQDILDMISGNQSALEAPAEQLREHFTEHLANQTIVADANDTVILPDGTVREGDTNVGQWMEAINQQAAGMPESTPTSVLQADLQQLLDLLAVGSGRDGVILQNGKATQSVEVVSSENMLQQNGEAMNTDRAMLTDPLTLLQRLVKQGIQRDDKGFLQQVLGNKDVIAYVKESLQNLWSIRPEEVSDKEMVEQLYQRMDKQLKGLAQVLETANQTDSQAYKATVNLTQNLDFLQQLNQTYTFLQLPLRLQQGNNAHGDLYVYSKKKHLASPDGKITALLHLDMEHLGALDVYVAMQQQKVSTKFYVQDEEILDFLEEHMDILTERLKKRGYDCSCDMLARDGDNREKETVVQKLLEQEPRIPIVQYAFDVRT